MKRVVIVVALFFMVLCVGIPAQAATLTVSIDGLELIDPDGIWTYQMNFAVEGNNALSVIFNETNQHQWEVAPGVSITNWNLASNVTQTDELVVLADDKSFGADSPLINGELFTVEYENATLTLLSYSFVLASDLVTPIDLYGIPSSPIYGEGANELALTTQMIPIPGAVLLLGSGILGLIGIRRRMR